MCENIQFFLIDKRQKEFLTLILSDEIRAGKF